MESGIEGVPGTCNGLRLSELCSVTTRKRSTNQNLPDRKLARYLLTVGVHVGGGTHKIKTASQREVYVKCIHAWNAWRKEESTDMKYYVDKEIPAIR